MEDDMDRDAARIFGAFLIGGLIGAAIAILYAPQSGRETREDISRAARRVKKSTVNVAEDIVESVNEFASEVKDKATDIIDRGRDLSDSAKREILKTLEHGQKAIEKQRKRITEALGL
jgi:gas vesicle protein